MVRFPLHPRFSRILLAGQAAGCEELVLRAIALLEVRQLILPLADKRKSAEREQWWVEAEGVSDLLRDVLVWQRAMEQGGSMAFCREWGVHGRPCGKQRRYTSNCSAFWEVSGAWMAQAWPHLRSASSRDMWIISQSASTGEPCGVSWCMAGAVSSVEIH
jgi:HrpA-like RNA helicase